MIKYTLFLAFGIFLLFTGCQDKQHKEQRRVSDNLNTLDVKLSETKLSCSIDSLDMMKITRLSQEQYDDLQLYNVKGLEGYTIANLCTGQTLIDSPSGKILTVQVITEGEITEYLLSYDKEGKLQDNLIVAYEDMVEYYSQISSVINSDMICVQTINFTYDGVDGNATESSDTSVVRYKISPEYRFVLD